MGAEPTLFDDDRGTRDPRPSSTRGRSGDRVAPAALGVADLNAAIDESLSRSFPTELWVRGEVASFRRRNSKHLHFELVERADDRSLPKARIDAVIFAMRWRRIESQLVRAGVHLADGMELCVRGTVDFYPPMGRVQFVVTGVDPAFTLGRMAADRDQLLRRLAAEGLLAANKQIVVPPTPLRIGVVTAVGSAADNDFRQEINRSGYGFRIVVADSRVQGPSAVPSTISAMRALVRVGVDVVAVVRGGGSRTDLSCFDDERLARAIAAMPVAVFTGIGHEIDTSVADHVAHSVFKTPTSCAAALVERVAGSYGELESLWASIRGVGLARVRAAESFLDDASRRSTRDALRGVATADHSVTAAHGRTRAAASAALRLAAARLDSAATAVRSFDPARVLERGYSITVDAEGRTVRDAGHLSTGAVVRTRFARGEATSEVLEIAPMRTQRDQQQDGRTT